MSEAAKNILVRYEGMRIHCLRVANFHPDTRYVCHQSLQKNPRATDMEVALAGLLDDMALVVKQLAATQPKDTPNV